MLIITNATKPKDKNLFKHNFQLILKIHLIEILITNEH